uniref:Uncharacterized protein n=1 Tax=Arundo donax TaxID=35708 RepID=A0A0A9D1K8_ARUDO
MTMPFQAMQLLIHDIIRFLSEQQLN